MGISFIIPGGSAAFAGHPQVAPFAPAKAGTSLSIAKSDIRKDGLPACAGASVESAKSAKRFGFFFRCGKCDDCVRHRRWLRSSATMLEMLWAPRVWWSRVSYAKSPQRTAARELAARYPAMRSRMMSGSSDLRDRLRLSSVEVERMTFGGRIQPAFDRLRAALRAAFPGEDVSGLMRYAVVAEHGDKNGRLHHHIVLCFHGVAAEWATKRKLESAFGAVRSNASARARQRLFGTYLESADLPSKDLKPLLRAAYGGHCRFTLLAKEKARHVSGYLAKYLAKGSGDNRPAYRFRASKGWGSLAADAVISDDRIVETLLAGRQSVQVSGVNIPRRYLNGRWKRMAQLVDGKRADRLEFSVEYQRDKVRGGSVREALLAVPASVYDMDIRTGYGAAQRPVTAEEFFQFAAYSAVCDQVLWAVPRHGFRVVSSELLALGAEILEAADSDAASWVERSFVNRGPILTAEDWAAAGIGPPSVGEKIDLGPYAGPEVLPLGDGSMSYRDSLRLAGVPPSGPVGEHPVHGAWSPDSGFEHYVPFIKTPGLRR